MFNSKLNTYREHYNILKNHEFLDDSLGADKLPRFKKMIEKIGFAIDYNSTSAKEKIAIGDRLR
jgi:hypothetical protein